MADVDFSAEDAIVPGNHAAAVTPSDSVDLDVTCRALWIGTTGDVAIITRGGETVTFTNVPVGFFEMRASRVLSTGTTASGIIAVW